MHDTPSNRRPPNQIGRWALIVAAVAGSAAAFGYVGGWLAPDRLSPAKVIDVLQANGGGAHPGFRRNHAKGICVAGYFESNGTLAPYSSSPLFGPGRTPFVGRFAVPGGNPYAPDSSVPIRSFALRFDLMDGEQWRTGMNAMPVFPVSTPEAFYEQQLAGQPDPATGKPDPERMKAFFASHPETTAFLAWVKTAKPSPSYATETYNSINAFYLRDTEGDRRAVRWRVVPEGAATAEGPAPDEKSYLDGDLDRRLASGPLRWHLVMTFAAPGDPVNDAASVWPDGRKEIDAGTVVVASVTPQDAGACRDVNYDPTVLPRGIEVSDDPLLAARSAAYADSYLRRTAEEGHLPGKASTQEAAR